MHVMKLVGEGSALLLEAVDRESERKKSVQQVSEVVSMRVCSMRGFQNDGC